METITTADSLNDAKDFRQEKCIAKKNLIFCIAVNMTSFKLAVCKCLNLIDTFNRFITVAGFRDANLSLWSLTAK